MIDYIEFAISLFIFNFLFLDNGETLKNVVSIKIPLPEFLNININNNFLGLCDSSNLTRNRRQDLYINSLL